MPQTSKLNTLATDETRVSIKRLSCALRIPMYEVVARAVKSYEAQVMGGEPSDWTGPTECQSAQAAPERATRHEPAPDSGHSWQIAALDIASNAALAGGIAGGLAVLAYAAWGLL